MESLDRSLQRLAGGVVTPRHRSWLAIDQGVFPALLNLVLNGGIAWLIFRCSRTWSVLSGEGTDEMGESGEMNHERRRFLAQAALLAGGTLSLGCTRALSLVPEDGPRTPSESLLDAGRRARLVRAVDLILPETDTPGAVAAGVPDFAEMMLVDYYYEDERDRVLAGLDELERHAQRDHGVGFVDAAEEEQVEILRELEREGLQALAAAGANPLGSFIGGPAAPPPAFFQSLRELVAVGFTTSAVAAQHVFDFTPYHHGFDACVPLTASARPSMGGR